MSERIYAWLLRLYPARFRADHGRDALQLFRDRLRDETGLLRRARLWIDIFFDLAVSLPRLNANVRPAVPTAPAGSSAGMPIFFVFEDEPVRPAVLLSSFVLALAAFALVTGLLNQTRTLPGGALRAARSMLPESTQASSANTAKTNVPSPDASGNATGGRFATAGSTPGKPGETVSPAANRGAGNATLDVERQRVLNAVVADVEQHYFDSAVAHRMADALTAHEQHGDDVAATDGKAFAGLLTSQMRDVSHDLHLEVVYSESALPPQPAAPETAAVPESLQREMLRENCFFRKVELLPHNIGYLKLDGFLEPSVCGATAKAAMRSLSRADALIIDLRDNRGGTSEMVSLIASYLFDHPEYMFDPRRMPTAQSWTSSPIPGSELSNKPVFILTSSTTISAAEQFTYDLKMMKRATIVGEVTAGGAHAGVWHRIDDHYGVAVPEVRVVNPFSKADWEGTGVQPDVKVPASEALEVALRQARAGTQRPGVSRR